MKHTTCNRCGEKIFFIKTQKNKKWVPVNYEYTKTSYTNFSNSDNYFLESGECLKGMRADECDYLYTPHFKSCGESDEDT